MKLWWLGLHWFVCKNGHMLPTGSLVIMCFWGERFCPTCLAKGWDMRMSTSSPPPWRNMRISDHKDGQCLKPIIDLHSWYLVPLPMFVIVHCKECEERKNERTKIKNAHLVHPFPSGHIPFVEAAIYLVKSYRNAPTLGYLQRWEMCKLFCLKNVSGGSFHNFIRVDICFASFDDKSPTLSPYQRTTFILCASTLIKEVYIISKTRFILSSTYKYR